MTCTLLQLTVLFFGSVMVMVNGILLLKANVLFLIGVVTVIVGLVLFEVIGVLIDVCLFDELIIERIAVKWPCLV